MTLTKFFFFFMAEGIPTIGMSPFSCGWTTSERNVRGIEK